MNTKLYELFAADRNAAIAKIESMDTALLFAELDDTLQFDVLHKSNLEWVQMPDMKLYRSLLQEIRQRCSDAPRRPPIDEPPMMPSEGGRDCPYNGEHPGIECQCDECDHYLRCFPEWERI